MVSMLEGSLARTIANATSFIFLDATLTRQSAAASADPADPGATTGTSYPCKAIEDTWSTGLLASGQIRDNDVRILILAATLAVEPQPDDRITIRGRTYWIVPAGTGGVRAVESDPAKATWSCRCE